MITNIVDFVLAATVNKMDAVRERQVKKVRDVLYEAKKIISENIYENVFWEMRDAKIWPEYFETRYPEVSFMIREKLELDAANAYIMLLAHAFANGQHKYFRIDQRVASIQNPELQQYIHDNKDVLHLPATAVIKLAEKRIEKERKAAETEKAAA